LTEIEYEGAGTQKKGITPEQIIGKLREVDVLLSRGTTVGGSEPKAWRHGEEQE